MLQRRVLACVVVGLGALLADPAVVRAQDLAGTWAVEGESGEGPHRGTAQVTRTAAGTWSIALDLSLRDHKKKRRTVSFEGRLDGGRLRGERRTPVGVVGNLLGQAPPAVPGAYVLSSDGLALRGEFGGVREVLVRAPAQGAVLLLDVDADGTLDSPAERGARRASVAFAPGKPPRIPVRVLCAGRVRVSVSGTATLVEPRGGAPAPDAPEPGVHTLHLVPSGAGPLELEARDAASGEVLDRAGLDLAQERLYLICFGFLGADVEFLEENVRRVRKVLVAALEAQGASVFDDGPAFEQAVLDRGLASRAPLKVIIDRNTTIEDWHAYLERGTVRGLFWNSHAFMEPYPGAPDAELLRFESRVCTAVRGEPSGRGVRIFVRDLEAALERQGPGPLDFGIFAACCTGGLGSYAEKRWLVCDPEIKERIIRRHGRLPDMDEIDASRTFQTLSSRFLHLQTFEGVCHANLYGVKLVPATLTLKPR